jgi:aldose 1-epimerase
MRLEYNSFAANFNLKGAYLEELKNGELDIIRKSMDGNSTHGGAAVLFPFGNRIRNAKYSFNKKDYELPKNDGENSIHGLVRDVDFDFFEEDNYIEFSTNFKSISYPGEAQIKIRYEIMENVFKTTFHVKSINNEIPVEIGFHPYFSVSGPYSISYSGTMKKLNYECQYFPDGSTADVDYNNRVLNHMPLDNCFELNSPVILKDNKHSIKITRTNMPYLVLYNGKYAGKNSVAIEPMTGAPDAFNNGIGLIKLNKGSEFECSYYIELLQ